MFRYLIPNPGHKTYIFFSAKKHIKNVKNVPKLAARKYPASLKNLTDQSLLLHGVQRTRGFVVLFYHFVVATCDLLHNAGTKHELF